MTITSAPTVRVSRENRGPGVALVFLGIALAMIGFLGLEFARLIKAAISRQREFLADASSVQFTRNPEGIAAALEKVRTAASGALIHNRYAEEASHMFFGQSIQPWFSGLFDTHPPIEERIRRVRPGFQRSRYRSARAALMGTGEKPVAVLDGAGNVVKTIGGGASGHVLDYANRPSIAAFFEAVGLFDHLVLAAAGPAGGGQPLERGVHHHDRRGEQCREPVREGFHPGRVQSRA